jgi:hypothetical protein
VSEPIRLDRRDRFAFAFRIGSALSGLALLVASLAAPSWRSIWIALFLAIAAGGGVAYHVLTSVVRCPGCRARVVDLGIGAEDAGRKTFHCGACGTVSFLTEGFFWQRDFSG